MHRALAVLAPLALLVAAACGGGGGGGGGGDGGESLAVTGFEPGTVYGAELTTFAITGTGFASDDGRATVHFAASSGSPFWGGTRDELEVEAEIWSKGEIRGQLDPSRVDASTAASLTVVLAGTGEATLEAPVRFEPQALTGFTPARIDGSREVAFTVSGLNLRPVGSDATVTFTATGTDLFFSGTNPQGSRTLTATGTVTSTSEVRGTTPYAGVVADAVVSVRVSLSTGASLNASDATTFEPGTTGVRGTWTYEAPDSTPSGLDYTAVSEKPVRRARVQLVEDSTGTVITTRVLGDDGRYEIHYGMDDAVRVRVLAATGPPAAPIQVEDNTNGDAIWANQGTPLQVLGSWEDRDYTVPLGWGGSGYLSDRASGPFSILDAVYEATEDFRAVRTVTFPLCRLNWSPDNRPETGSIADGAIGTSYYDPTGNQIYLLGQEDVDTDEYDTHVVVHEWGHFFEANLSRTDSWGGAHSPGDRLDPTVAFGEGWCSALSALVLSPDTTYTDASGTGQAAAFWFDLEDNASDTNNPGWYSESSVQWIVHDLFDAVDESWDTVSLGMGSLYDVLTGTMKNTGALTTIFALVDGLKDTHAGARVAIDVLCQHHAIAAVADEWGTGETNDGGWSANLPVYHWTPVGTTGHTLTFHGAYDWNRIEAVRLLYFQGTGAFVTIDATTSEPSGPYKDDHDIDVEVYESGVSRGYADDVWFSTETVRLTTRPTAKYVVRITDLGSKPGTYTCTVDVKNE